MPHKIIRHFFLLLAILLATVTEAQNLDIGIFPGITTGIAQIKVRPDYSDNRFLTNMQYTIKWPANSGSVLTPGTFVSPYNMQAQGFYVANGYNYQVFATPGGNSVNWQPGTEYLCATFSYTGNNCFDFEIADDAWTQANNGDFYVEINGGDVTGVIYQATMPTGTFPQAAPAISGEDTVIQSTSSVIYNIPVLANANSYAWNYSGNGVTINGTTNSVILDFSSTATSGILTVSGINNCGNGLVSPDFPITVVGPVLTSNYSISQDSVCEGDSVQFFVNAGGGNGNYSYHWYCPNINNPVWQSSLQNPVFVAGNHTDTIYLYVSDGNTTLISSFLIHAFARPQGILTGIDTICEGDSATFYLTLQGIPPFSFLLNFGSATWSVTNYMQFTYSITLGNVSGILSASALSDMHCNGTVSGFAELIVNIIPATAVVTQNGLVLMSSAFAGNQWYNSTGPIIGATAQNYAPVVEEYYYVIVTMNGCSSMPSNSIHFSPDGIPEKVLPFNHLTIFPNPAPAGPVHLHIESTNTGIYDLEIYTLSGILVKHMTFTLNSGESDKSIDMSELNTGVYILSLKDEKYHQVLKLIIQ